MARAAHLAAATKPVQILVTGDTICREAARILARIVSNAHILDENASGVEVQVSLSVEDFDRLCIWGASREDFEDEASEDGGDFEQHHHD